MDTGSSNSSSVEVIEISTREKKPRQVSPAKAWCFTWFNYPTNWKEIVPKFQEYDTIIGYIAGEEQCPKTLKWHIQGYLESKQKLRPHHLIPEIKWWICARGNMTSNYKYCSKKGNWIQWGTCRQKIDMTLQESDLIPFDELFDWGKELENRVKDCLPHKTDRTIYWYWSQQGQMKKTETARRLAYYYDACIIQGSKRHILGVAYKHPAPIYILLVPRTDEGAVSYASIELLKDNLYMSGFGTEATGSVNRKKPWVIVMCNFEPAPNTMSEDRYKTFNIDI